MSTFISLVRALSLSSLVQSPRVVLSPCRLMRTLCGMWSCFLANFLWARTLLGGTVPVALARGGELGAHGGAGAGVARGRQNLLSRESLSNPRIYEKK